VRHIASILSLTLMLACLSGEVRAQSPADQAAVLQAEEAFRVAKIKNDTAALAAMVADQFFETNQNGNSRNKAQLLELFRNFSINTLTLDDSHVRVAGNTAFVTGTQTEDGDPMLFMRAYIRSGGGWQLLACMQTRRPADARLGAAETEVMRADEAYRVAKLNRDTRALEAILADGFNETNQNGNSRNKAETIDLWRTFSIQSLTTDTFQVRISGATAIVTGTQTEDGNEHMLFTRVYVKAAHGWQLLSSMQYRNPNSAV
jgi:ketosteroid isomerase-like protein